MCGLRIVLYMFMIIFEFVFWIPRFEETDNLILHFCITEFVFLLIQVNEQGVVCA
jgi:hypothetical protein